VYRLHSPGNQTRSHNMNTVGAEASSEAADAYIRSCTYIMYCYTYTRCILRMHNNKKHLCQDHKINTLITQCAL
jgi:hypothetical protein